MGAEDTARAVENAGVGARLMQFDVSDRPACRAAIEADIDANGAYYGVINNAGISRDNAFPSLSDDDWDSVIDTNLDSFFNVIQPCVMPMVRARIGGRIITISSVSGCYWQSWASELQCCQGRSHRRLKIPGH